ncbi:MAG: 6,7-dimethyl-8-ribityllumazine synthase [Bacteroidota bacterium]|nr:6,7-dimethyl-8-ribityllumazine synthase [Bacteroidota bacterium]
MSTKFKNLSNYDKDSIPDASGISFGIVVSEWNEEITGNLLEGALNTLQKHGAKRENIQIKFVPGSFELTYAAKVLAEEQDDLDAIICLGCVIKGETPHFDYICQSVSYGLTELNLSYELPFIFGVLTTNTMQQARDRSGGKYGNKGDEAAVTAIKMAYSE